MLAVCAPILAGTAPASVQTPQTTGQFLTYCRSPSGGGAPGTSAALTWYYQTVTRASACAESEPPKMLAAAAVVGQVVGWLKAHPETQNDDMERGIEAAAQALWPPS